jgi:hypothetical protein
MTTGFDLSFFQAEAESRMRDTCSVTLPASGPGTVDPGTGLESDLPGSLVYSGKCRLRMAGKVATSGTSSTPVAGDMVVTSTPMLHVPVSAPRLPVGAIVKMMGVPADDPAGHLRLGLRLRVTGLVLGTDMTAQRVTVEAVTG